MGGKGAVQEFPGTDVIQRKKPRGSPKRTAITPNRTASFVRQPLINASLRQAGTLCGSLSTTTNYLIHCEPICGRDISRPFSGCAPCPVRQTDSRRSAALP